MQCTSDARRITRSYSWKPDRYYSIKKHLTRFWMSLNISCALLITFFSIDADVIRRLVI